MHPNESRLRDEQDYQDHADEVRHRGDDVEDTEDTAESQDRQREFAEPEARQDEFDETGTERELSPAEPQPRAATTDDGSAAPELFEAGEVDRFRVEWQEVQSRFVDDPRDAVQQADQLVDNVMRSLSNTFADRKHDLEKAWQRGGEGSQQETEDLRQALRGYRTFFNRLLTH